MKKRILTFLFCVFAIFSITYPVFAENEEVMESQKDSLNISGFIKQADEYSSEAIEGMDIKELLDSAIQGKIDNTKIFKNVFNVLGKEVRNSLTIMRWHFSHYFNT